MFSLEEIKEYWCIVSVNDDKDDARIMRVSEDVTKDADLQFCNGTHMTDTEIDCQWYEDWLDEEATVAGVYMLTLEPIYGGDDDDDDEDDSDKKAEPQKDFDYFKVTSAVVMFAI